MTDGIGELIALAGEYLTSDTVVSGLAAGAAGAAVTSALAPKPGSPPPIKPPAPMPNQTAVDQARRRSLAQQLSRRGRASTILTDPGDTLG